MDLSKLTTDKLVRELERRREQTYSEDAEWLPDARQLGGTKGRGHSSRSSQLLGELEVGDVKRIYHSDINCHKKHKSGYHCGLSGARGTLRKHGFVFSIYHEAEHVAIVARNK